MECQAGFRPQRSCADQLFSLRHLSDLVGGARQQRLHLCFVDLCKAFDSINRDSLWAILWHRGLPEQLIIVRDLHTGTSCRVRMGGELSAAIPTTCGTHQGDPLGRHALRDLF